MTLLSRFTLSSLIFCIVMNYALTVLAEDSGKYGNWQSSEDRIEQMISELDEIIDEGKKARAAHPDFLQDLNSIIDRYRPLRKVVFFSDDFSDSNFTENPAWNVNQGTFSIDVYGALYSSVEAARPVMAKEKKPP